MKVLVTGGTGFLGRAVVERLAPRHDLLLLVRAGSSREGFPPGVGFAEGDVTDRGSLERAAAGCDALLHAAALVKLVAPTADYDRVNVAGVEHAVAAARNAGVARILYVSSFIALGPSDGAPGRVLDESAAAGERRWINDYERTKTRAERWVRRAIAEGAPVSVVYPGVVYGPGAMTQGNFVVRGILEVLHGRVPALVGDPESLWSYVYVADVADGIARALEAPTGGRWILGGDNVTLGELYRLLGELSGVAPPRRWLSTPVAKALGAAMKGWARLSGGEPRLTPDVVEVCRHSWAYSSRRAEEGLGYRFRPLRQGLAETLRWLEESGAWRR